MPLYFALPASVKLGMVQVVALPELLELDDELLELEEELEDELLELDEEEDELVEEVELEEELDEELELDELELDGVTSPLQATNVEKRTNGVAHLPKLVILFFMLVTKCIELKLFLAHTSSCFLHYFTCISAC